MFCSVCPSFCNCTFKRYTKIPANKVTVKLINYHNFKLIVFLKPLGNPFTALSPPSFFSAVSLKRTSRGWQYAIAISRIEHSAPLSVNYRNSSNRHRRRRRRCCFACVHICCRNLIKPTSLSNDDNKSV